MLTAYKVIALVATGLRHVAILKIKILFQNDQILLPKKVVFICSLSSKHTPLAYRSDIPITKLAHWRTWASLQTYTCGIYVRKRKALT